MKRFLMSDALLRYQHKNYTQAQTLLNNLPNNDEYADLKTLYTLYYNLSSHGKTLWDINPTEETLLRQLANSPSKANFNARAALLMLYGEEYSIQLPAIDGTNEPFNIGFKTNSAPNTMIAKLYPNPATDFCYLDYVLPNTNTATFMLYDVLGTLQQQYLLEGTGQLNINTKALTTGVYYYRIMQDGNTLQSDKFYMVK